AGLDVAAIRASIGADTLGYVSLDGLVAASEQPRKRLCRACFDGEYPIPLPAPELVGKHLLERAGGQPPPGSASAPVPPPPPPRGTADPPRAPAGSPPRPRGAGTPPPALAGDQRVLHPIGRPQVCPAGDRRQPAGGPSCRGRSCRGA